MAASATRNVGNNLQISKSFKIFPGAPSPRVARSPRLSQSTSRLPPRLPVAPSPSECFGMLPVPQPPERDTRVFRHRAVAGGSSVPASSGRLGSTGLPGWYGCRDSHPVTPNAGSWGHPRPETAHCTGQRNEQRYPSPGGAGVQLPATRSPWLGEGTSAMWGLLLPLRDQEPFLSWGCEAPNAPRGLPESLAASLRRRLGVHSTARGGHTRLPGKNASKQNSLLLKITVRMSNSLLPSFVPNKQAAPWLSLTGLGSLGFEQSAALENSAFAPSQHPARAQECVYWP